MNLSEVPEDRVSASTDRIRTVEGFRMAAKLQLRADLLLLVSLLLIILLNPLLDHGDRRRLVLTALTVVPVTLSATRLWQIRKWVWASMTLMLGYVVLLVVSFVFANRLLSGIRFGLLAVFFAHTATGLFSYLKNSRSIGQEQLYTAVSIYLLLGIIWAALYCAMDIFHPGSIQLGSNTSDRQSTLLYFSLITLSTVGYGDVVPLSGEARLAAALEGITGVLYIAITVAILVSSYRRGPSDEHDIN